MKKDLKHPSEEDKRHLRKENKFKKREDNQALKAGRKIKENKKIPKYRQKMKKSRINKKFKD
jgi:hypothetical protein